MKPFSFFLISTIFLVVTTSASRLMMYSKNSVSVKDEILSYESFQDTWSTLTTKFYTYDSSTTSYERKIELSVVTPRIGALSSSIKACALVKHTHSPVPFEVPSVDFKVFERIVEDSTVIFKSSSVIKPQQSLESVTIACQIRSIDQALKSNQYRVQLSFQGINYSSAPTEVNIWSSRQLAEKIEISLPQAANGYKFIANFTNYQGGFQKKGHLLNFSQKQTTQSSQAFNGVVMTLANYCAIQIGDVLYPSVLYSFVVKEVKDMAMGLISDNFPILFGENFSVICEAKINQVWGTTSVPMVYYVTASTSPLSHSSVLVDIPRINKP